MTSICMHDSICKERIFLMPWPVIYKVKEECKWKPWPSNNKQDIGKKRLQNINLRPYKVIRIHNLLQAHTTQPHANFI